VGDVRAELRAWLVTKQREARRPELADGPGGAAVFAGQATGYGHVIDHLDRQRGPLDLADLRGWLETQQAGSDQQARAAGDSWDAGWQHTGTSMAYGYTRLELAAHMEPDPERADAAEWTRQFEGALRAHQARVGPSAGPGQAAGAVSPAVPTTGRAAPATSRSRVARPGPAVPDRSA
jgi:hypothetical protein